MGTREPTSEQLEVGRAALAEILRVEGAPALAPGDTPAQRLDPEVFRLPVERIRDGYYSDAYFNFTKELLEGDGRHPRVRCRSSRSTTPCSAASTRRSPC